MAVLCFAVSTKEIDVRRKNQKDALLLVKKIGRCSQLDFTIRGIPMSAVNALVIKGLIMKTQGRCSEFVITEAGMKE